MGLLAAKRVFTGGQTDVLAARRVYYRPDGFIGGQAGFTSGQTDIFGSQVGLLVARRVY
jgi:hypothetical protein